MGFILMVGFMMMDEEKRKKQSNSALGYDVNKANVLGFHVNEMQGVKPVTKTNTDGAQTWLSQNFNRTFEGNKQNAAEINRNWQDGNYARAAGGYVGGAFKGARNLLADTAETTLNHSIFPVVDGAIEFGKGVFGVDDKPKTKTVDSDVVSRTAQPLSKQPVSAQSAGAVGAVQSQPLTREVDVSLPKTGMNQNQAAGFDSDVANRALSAQSAASAGLGYQPQLAAGSGSASGGRFGLNVNMPSVPDFNRQVEQPFVASLGGNKLSADERRALMSAALTPHKGAQNGQLTANQLNTVRGLLESEQRNAFDLQKAQEQLANQYQIAQNNNQNALQRDWLQQQGGLNRDALNHFANLQREQMSQDGQNQRSVLSGSLDLARTAENARQFDVKNAREQALLQRMDGLKERLINAKDDNEKSAIQRELAILSGQGEPQVGGFNKDAYMKLSRNVIGANGMPITQDDVVDLRTGQSILNGSAGHIKVGQVVDGMRFKGGNPQDEKNWEQVK